MDKHIVDILVQQRLLSIESTNNKVIEVIPESKDITLNTNNINLDINVNSTDVSIDPNVTQVDVITKPVFMMGPKGLNAYEVAIQMGFVGTELEWLDSLKAELTWSSTNW